MNRTRQKGKARIATKNPVIDDALAQELLSLQNSLGLPDGRPPEDEEQRRLAVAMHEAGHAVVGHVLGRRLRAVSISEHCEFESVEGPGKADREISIKIALAGLHAEVLLLDCGCSNGGGTDLLTARTLAKEISAEWEVALQRLSDETGALVLNERTSVRAVAEALAKPGARLDSSALLAVLERSTLTDQRGLTSSRQGHHLP
jgi:hypothetical protein